MRRWSTKDREVLFQHGLFNLERRRITAGDEERQALVIDSPDWVQIIPILDDGRILMIRQFRYGTEDFYLELPGGVVEDEDERTGAERELLEETGHRAQDWQRLGEVDPNPAILNNKLGIWVARDLVRVGEPQGDGEEEIELVPLTLAEIEERMADGRIKHALMLSSFQLFALARRSQAL